MPEQKTNPKIQIRIASWTDDKEALSAIRKQVFIDEQMVPEELEWDEYDDLSTHYLATLNGEAIASARLKSDGQIGRMAVLPLYRNRGTGSKLLNFVLKDATAKMIKQVYLHAQVSAMLFYEKHGFTAKGEIFYEANIPHQEMLKKIC